jgi:hypothetical protein
MVLVGIYYFNLFEERGRGQINYNLLDHEFCPYIGILPKTNWEKVGVVALRMGQNTGPK